MSDALREEQARLTHCLQRIRSALADNSGRVQEHGEELQTRKTYLWEARRDLDHIEKVAVRQSIDQTTRSADMLLARERRLLKLLKSPYFGRFDFRRTGEEKALPVYVGMHHLEDPQSRESLVYDWRAPVSSMFYDFEPGPARYTSPEGTVAGDMLRKRQFRIREGKLDFLLEADVTVMDELLQQELSQASDAGMRHIVATIQRDQNAIVRNEEAHTLIIQGVAGSGKTSIALHRIAYLLYRFKETLSSDDILILSPNRVFADYISNVLPELGEEQVGEIGIETLATELLDSQYRFQTFFEQTAALLEGKDPELETRIAFKAAPTLLGQLGSYAAHVECSNFEAREWRLGRNIVPDWHFAETWEKHKGVALTERIGRVLKATELQISVHYRRELETRERQELREAIRSMVRTTTLREAYRGFYSWLERPELFKPVGSRLEYADVFPLIFLKLRLEGLENPRRHIKHLLIDEMQDYTPVQYAVLDRLFTCRKTVLGDAGQTVNPCGASTAESIQRALRGSTCVHLMRSYRSTREIMDFALTIRPNDELETLPRHGPAPQVHCCKSAAAALSVILQEIATLQDSEHNSLALVAKTPRQAARLHKRLQDASIDVRLLDAGSTGYSSGIMLTTAYLAKGLEFDRVIVVDVDADNYHSELDRSLLYVACTRAMHVLTLVCVKTRSPLLPATTPSTV